MSSLLTAAELYATFYAIEIPAPELLNSRLYRFVRLHSLSSEQTQITAGKINERIIQETARSKNN